MLERFSTITRAAALRYCRSSMDKIEVGFHEVNPTYNIGDRTLQVINSDA
jgi:hypothetical protein